ncbi:hypothetical protein [Thalassotalea sediminis]|uniref:hypothetical protein n=1 Tax=Thalassotalea sediminis TaxID=1759089 RepID=UPI0025739836|nr:hypothetical protein [Thalassotalea sediminis]
MFNFAKKVPIVGIIALAFLLPHQVVAQDTFVRDKIENFSILGISLNTKSAELDRLLNQHPLQFKCNAEQSGISVNRQNYSVEYRKCKANGVKIELTITLTDEHISQVHFRGQSKKNYHAELLSDIKILSQDLIKAGKVLQKSHPKSSDKEGFFYRSDEMAPGMSDTNLALITPATCIHQVPPTVVGLSARIMEMPGLNDVAVTVSNGNAHLC